MANIGYPDTKNKKQSAPTSPFFSKKKDREEMTNTILERNDSLSRNDAETVAKNRARMAENARKGVEHAEWLAKKPGSKKNTSTNTKKTTPKKKTSYSSAYEKAKKNDPGRYGKMSQEEYTAEAKRQKAHFDKTGKWDYKGEHKTDTETKKIAKDPKDVTSENVPVKSNKQRRKEKRATKRVTKLQKKAVAKGSLTNAQKKRLARNEQKSKGEKVSDENRTKAGKLIGKVGSKIKAKIAERKKKKEEEKKNKNK